MNVKNFSQDFSRIIKIVGATPFIILTALPSVVLIGFNIVFTSTVVSLLIQTLDLASVIGKMVRGLLYLSTTLLIMKPLLEMLFTSSNNELTDTEKKWLNLFNRLSIGILIFTALLFLGCWLGFIGKGDIIVDIYIPKTNLTPVESFINVFYTIEVKNSSRPIQLIEGVIIFVCLGIIYFTDSAAGICLSTVKDILFPDMFAKGKTAATTTNLLDKFNGLKSEVSLYETDLNVLFVQTGLTQSDKPAFNTIKSKLDKVKIELLALKGDRTITMDAYTQSKHVASLISKLDSEVARLPL